MRILHVRIFVRVYSGPARTPILRRAELHGCILRDGFSSVDFFQLVEQLFEFAGNHYILVGLLLFLVVAFIINEGKQGGAAISPTNLVKLVNREGAVIVDIRDGKEFGDGHIAGAVNMPASSFDSRSAELDSFKDKPVVLVCKIGQHAGAVGRKLKAQGYENVRRLSGGMSEWSASNLPVVK
jgi:rhodanese-related sulfurtransferase